MKASERDPTAVDLDLLPEAVVLLDADGVVVAANDRAVRGLGLDDAVGRPVEAALDARNAAGGPCERLVPRDVAPGVAERLAERVVDVHASGRGRPWAMAGRRHADGWVLTFRSAARRQAGAHAQADVVATVSHEIRSPLTSVKGFTRTLLRRWDVLPDDHKRQMLATIDSDADRVTRLLTELLDVARIDTGRVQLHRRVLRLAPLVTRVVERVGAGSDDTRVEVDVDGADDRLVAFADEDKLTQVLVNLVENALRHAPGAAVVVRARREDDTAVLDVLDDGPGIDADDAQRIFTKFGRGRGSHRAGTGLGLFVTRGLARAHGGDVTVGTAPGGGARFTVTLPAVSGLEDQLATAADRAAHDDTGG